MSQPIIDQVTGLVQSFDARVQSAAPTSWANQSPCTEWKARDVVVHVAGNLSGIDATLSGTEPRSIAPDDDIVAAWDATRDSFLGTLQTADLTTQMDTPFGPQPAGQFLARIISTDLLVHSWDLARATSGDERLDPNIVAASYSGLKSLDEAVRRPGVFGPKVDPPADADLQTEFLAFTGRTV